MACLQANFWKSLLLLVSSLVEAVSAISTASVTLNIQNINDYAPDFPNSISSINITAGDYSKASRLLVLQLEAEDGDIGPPGNVTYSISGVTPNGMGKFDLREDGTLWLVAPAWAGDVYVLVVEARDMGTRPRQDHTAVVVSVMEEPTEGPAFPTELYTVRVSEGVKPGSHIVTIQAIDHDDSLLYRIETGNDNGDFAIDDETGVLTNVNELSIAKTKEYMLTVAVYDSQGLSATTTVDIQVTAHIEHKPASLFVPSVLYLVHVGDSTIANTTIFTVPAVAASNDSLVYSITDGNTDGDFAIDPTTGDVTLVHALNHSRQHMYELTININTNGGESATTRLRIFITHTNHPLALDQGRDNVYTNKGCNCDGGVDNGVSGNVSGSFVILALLVCQLIVKI